MFFQPAEQSTASEVMSTPKQVHSAMDFGKNIQGSHRTRQVFSRRNMLDKKKTDSLNRGMKTAYRCNLMYDHNDHVNRSTNVPPDIKKFIIELMENNPGATPKTFLHRCQEKYK